MRLVIQRVSRAGLSVGGEVVSEIGPGMVVLVGVGHGDTPGDIEFLSRKVAQLRIFNDEEGKMNASIESVNGSFLVVSQFTLYGDCRKGNRPGYSDAARPEEAVEKYEAFATSLREKGFTVKTGVFQAEMKVELVNDGPVTLILESAGR
ncbi:MAG: D-aminoacyl-tRNA deacylase [Verrucomicrobiota bacterium]